MKIGLKPTALYGFIPQWRVFLSNLIPECEPSAPLKYTSLFAQAETTNIAATTNNHFFMIYPLLKIE